MITDYYVRKAKVTKVVDGDTFDARVDLGFTVSVDVRFRLRGIDCPEMIGESKERGALAKQRVEQLMLETGSTVYIQSFKASVYNRWEADVILADGRSLANILISEGHVK